MEWIDACFMSEIVSLLANPVRDQFHCRGLVVGYVQSGKTANVSLPSSRKPWTPGTTWWFCWAA